MRVPREKRAPCCPLESEPRFPWRRLSPLAVLAAPPEEQTPSLHFSGGSGGGRRLEGGGDIERPGRSFPPVRARARSALGVQLIPESLVKTKPGWKRLKGMAF